jgi:hypothetical protein
VWLCTLVCTSGACVQRPDLVPGAAAATAVAVRANSTTLLCTVPPLPPGAYRVRAAVRGDDVSEYFSPAAVTVLTPTLLSLSPASVPQLEASTVTINGANFVAPSAQFPLRGYVNATSCTFSLFGVAQHLTCGCTRSCDVSHAGRGASGLRTSCAPGRGVQSGAQL